MWLNTQLATKIIWWKNLMMNVFEENLIAVLTNLLMLFTVVSHSGFQELQLGMTSDRSQCISHTH